MRPAIATGRGARAACCSLTGLPYEGESIDYPSLQPVVLAGLEAAAVVPVITFALLWWGRRRRQVTPLS